MSGNDLESQAAALAALLEKAMQADPGSNFPEDPNEFKPQDLRSWSEVAAALSAYSHGLPKDKKFVLLERCKELTQQGHPNPTLTVQVARMPVLDGFSTKSAKRIVKTSTRKKRTGLTRQSMPGVSLMSHHSSSGVPMMGNAERASAPSHAIAEPMSPQQLRLTEQAARLQQQKLETMAPEDRSRPIILVQTRRAWDKLRVALTDRRKYLAQNGAPEETLTAYESAAQHIQEIIDGLK